MKLLKKMLTNKRTLQIVSVLALLNVIGYAVMKKWNVVLFFVLMGLFVRIFSKNMILVLGVPLFLSNAYALYLSRKVEGLRNKGENDSTSDTNSTNTDSNTDSNTNSNNNTTSDNKKENKEKPIPPSTSSTSSDSSPIMLPISEEVASNMADKSGFEVGRRKNGGNKIDYATTIEDAYDQLNSILGSEGIKSLTNDTQRLMQQQMELAKSMEAMTPLIKGIMPMAEKAQEMMKSMDTGSGGLGNIMEMAKKLGGGSK
jgi:hypothetical protein